MVLGAGCASVDRVAVEAAVGFLSREVPRWPRENGCFSCHNSGDGARALFEARRRGLRVSPSALAETEDWLARPQDWEKQKGDPAFADATLARVQFAAAAASAGRLAPDALNAVLAVQSPDGSWVIEPREAMGSPASWGTHLATALALRSLSAAASAPHSGAIEAGREWLSSAPARDVVEAAAIVLGLEEARDEPPSPPIAAALSLLARARGASGGWGPYPDAPPEPFDTALALLALARLPRDAARREWIEAGRAFLIARQAADGGWPATTRPRGGESYAQSISTSAWVTLALLATEER